jgi:hypothetical protein
LGSEYSSRTNLKVSRHFLFYRFEATICGFRKIHCGLFLKGISSVFERFIEAYHRNLTCWE